MQKKKTFRDICELHELTNVHLQRLALRANVSKSIIDALYHGTAIEPEAASRIVAALVEITGRQYTLADVDIPVMDLGWGGRNV